jgi:hypothetical protein
MSQGGSNHPDPMKSVPRHISVRSLVGSILLVCGIIVWFGLMWTIYGFSVAVGEFLRVVISLSNSAG